MFLPTPQILGEINNGRRRTTLSLSSSPISAAIIASCEFAISQIVRRIVCHIDFVLEPGEPIFHQCSDVRIVRSSAPTVPGTLIHRTNHFQAAYSLASSPIRIISTRLLFKS